jgi:hypothetical protein
MGIDIPVDLEIAIDVLSLHYDPEIWGPEDPNVFYPQRFVCLNTTLNKRNSINKCFFTNISDLRLNEMHWVSWHLAQGREIV